MYERMVKLMMLGLVFCFAGHVSAAVITWEEPFNTAGPEDVLTVGTLHEAINASSAAGEVVINGVTFTNSNDLLPKNAPTGRLAGATTGDADYDALLNTLDWGGGTGPTFTLGGGTLVPGAPYIIQVWFTDLLNDAKKAGLLAVADEFGNSVTLHAGGGEFGQYAIGSFTADETGNQTLALTATNFGNAHFTGYQIRKDEPKTQAVGPIPSNGAQDIPRDGLNLEWTAGEFAATHVVYFGTDFNDVNEATTASPEFKGNQTETTYALDRLEFAETYYWRIDEVNNTDPNSPWKGGIWSFTVEPEGYLVAQDLLTASASSQNSADENPNNTINGAGLNPDGSHSGDKTTMWLSAASDPGTAWIRYDLSAPRKLVEMLVWNHNTDLESLVGFGIKEALIEVSLDGNDFTSLGIVELARAAETAVDLQGVLAQSVRITAQSDWGSIFAQYGLSEVRMSVLPTVAREMSPADGATNMDPTTAVLTWRAGREADVHDVYISTDEQAVIDGTAPVVTLPDALYAPDLALGTTNYWRVDEVNDLEDPNVWAGSVQSFSTTDYIVVDDMEFYSVYAGEEFFATWADGYEKPANGALVGHGFYAEPETQIVHDGAQSMPLYYGEDGAAVSEATRPIDAQDWSKYGIQSLSLYLHGDANNIGGQLYVKINDTQFDYQGGATDIQTAQWFPFTIDLTGVTLVNSLTIGVLGGSGTFYVDDICLYAQNSELITPVQPDAANLQISYLFEGNFNDNSGNGHHGTALGTAVIAADPARGQVLSLDGNDSAVDVPFISVADEVTIAMWLNLADLAALNSAFMSNGWEPNAVHTRISDSAVNMGMYGAATGDTLGNLAGKTIVAANEWIYVSYTVKNTATETTRTVWLNGVAEASVTEAVDPEVGRRTVWIGNGAIGAWINDGAPDRELNGLIDDVMIYDRALSAAEIAGLAGRTAPLYKPL